MIRGTENTIILWLWGTRAFTSQDERRDEYTELTSLKAEHIPKKKAFPNCGFPPSLWLAWCKDLRGGDGKTNEDCEKRCLGGRSRPTGWSHHREMPQRASAVLLRILLTRNTGACVCLHYIYMTGASTLHAACIYVFTYLLPQRDASGPRQMLRPVPRSVPDTLRCSINMR